jgi:hypothetical protein
MTYTSLAEEIAFYEEHSKEYRQKYAGRYLLIHGSSLIGVYDDEVEACYDGYRQIWSTGTEQHGYLVVKAGDPAVKTITVPFSVLWTTPAAELDLREA